MIKNIALIRGDGIGPEIVEQAQRVLNRVAELYGHTFIYTEVAMGGNAIDRFGDPPKTVAGLVDVALVRNRAAALGVKEISQRNGQMLFFFEHLIPELSVTVASTLKGQVLVSAGEKPYISVRMKNEKDSIPTIRRFLDAAEGLYSE